MRYPSEPVYPSSQALSAMIDLMIAPADGAVVRAFTMRIDQRHQDQNERESLYSVLAHQASLRGYTFHAVPVPKYREMKDKPMEYQFHIVWLLKEDVS